MESLEQVPLADIKNELKQQTLLKIYLHLKHKIELTTGKRFNSLLVNLYRDGQDSVAYHADNEAILGTNPDGSP